MELQLVFALLLGAGISGFVNGFAGFGTALFASGIWFLVLPFEVVPPLVVISAVTGQITGLFLLRKHLSFNKAFPLISGGIAGVPIGTLSLLFVSASMIELAIALLLVGYAVWQLRGTRHNIRFNKFGRFSERVVGFLGGILGGVAGLSGPLPIIWFQLQGMATTEQRARYQPFNLAILCLTLVSMGVLGIITREVLWLSVLSVPATVLASLLGVWCFKRTDPVIFQRWILRLLLLSGATLLGQQFI